MKRRFRLPVSIRTGKPTRGCAGGARRQGGGDCSLGRAFLDFSGTDCGLAGLSVFGVEGNLSGRMSDSESDASTAAAADRVPATPEQVKESDELKTQANKKFQENHHNEAVDLYTKQVPRPSCPIPLSHYLARDDTHASPFLSWRRPRPRACVPPFMLRRTGRMARVLSMRPAAWL